MIYIVITIDVGIFMGYYLEYNYNISKKRRKKYEKDN